MVATIPSSSVPLVKFGNESRWSFSNAQGENGSCRNRPVFEGEAPCPRRSCPRQVGRLFVRKPQFFLRRYYYMPAPFVFQYKSLKPQFFLRRYYYMPASFVLFSIRLPYAFRSCSCEFLKLSWQVQDH